MQLKFQITENILIVELEGELDHHGAVEVRKEIDGAMDAFGVKHIILDFLKVGFVDSSGIGMIMGRYNKVTVLGGLIYISGCSKYMKKILEMAGIFTIAPECENPKQAIEKIMAFEEARAVFDGEQLSINDMAKKQYIKEVQ